MYNLTKIGRNELCPCGSGKKYKKCCLIKQEQKRFLRKSLDNLQEAKEQLLSQVNFFNIFPRYVSKFFGLPNIRALGEAFHTYVEWHLLNFEDEDDYDEDDYEVEPNQTFFDRFFSIHTLDNPHTDEEIEAMKSWKYNKPSVYRVEQIDANGLSINVTDIFTGQKHLIDLRGMAEQNNTSLNGLHNKIITATLLQTPIEGEFLPFININVLPGKAEKELYEMVNDAHNKYNMDWPYSVIGGFYSIYEAMQLHMIDNFIEEDTDWEKEIYKEAAHMFIKKMKEIPTYSSDTIFLAVETWHYCANSEMPNLKKPNAVAAALEYFTAKNEIDAHLRKISQKELAQKYSTSTQSIAKYYDLLDDYLEDDMADFFETVMDEDIEEEFDLDEDMIDFMKNEMNASKIEELLEILDVEASPENCFGLAIEAIEADIDLAMGLFEIVIEMIEDSHEDYNSIYLRSKIYLSLLHNEKGETEVAIERLYNILNSSPDERFDIYFFLIPLILREGRIEEAQEAISKYKEHEKASFISYCELIVHFVKYGFDDKECLDELVKKAHKDNPFVVSYIKEQANTAGLLPKASKNKTKIDAEWFFNLTSGMWHNYPELTDYIVKNCTQHQYSLDDYL